jgi:hypothetical protein
VVRTVAQLVIGALAGGEPLGAKAPWIIFLAGRGAIVLTFLAGAELDPAVFWPVVEPKTPFDRHRGGGRPPTPATPPCVWVRTRRFESVTLTLLE